MDEVISRIEYRTQTVALKKNTYNIYIVEKNSKIEFKSNNHLTANLVYGAICDELVNITTPEESVAQ